MIAIICVVAGIVGVAWFNVWKAAFDPPRHNISHVDFFREGVYPYRPDRELGFVPSPNYAGIRKASATTHFIFDSRGARVDGPGHPPVSGIDLIGIGGSIAWGEGIKNEDTYTALVAKAVGMTSLNFAVSNYGGVQSVIRLRRNLDLRPKVVLYGFWMDHWKRNVRRCQAIRPPVCLEAPRIVFRQDGKPTIVYPEDPERTLKRIRSWYLEAAGGEYSSFWTDLYWTATELFRIPEYETQERRLNRADSWRKQVEAARFVLREMKRAADSVDARLVVAYIPSYLDSPVPETPKELIDICGELDIHLVELTGVFRSLKVAGKPIWIEGDGHPTAETNRAMAEAIISSMRAEGF